MSSSVSGDSLCELGEACTYLHVFILLSDVDSEVWCLSLIWENFYCYLFSPALLRYDWQIKIAYI